MNKVIALLGNPNSGKTTLFNTLTGTYQKTGNWTGVTTEEKVGYYKKDKSIKIVDLPGIYSISSGVAEEKVVINFLKEQKVNAIINIVDGTNLERNLFLTTELLELKIPIVIAVNMYDDLVKNNIELNTKIISKELGVPVVPVSALKNLNVDLLIKEATNNKKMPLELNLEAEKGEDLTKARYEFIERHIKDFIRKKQTKAEIITQKIDNVCTNKYFAIPIFLIVITIVYFLSIKIGGFFSRYIEALFGIISSNTRINLSILGCSEWIVNLVCDAVLKGVGSVFAFLPQILVLFTLITIIEQSGYASRIAFILDKIFRRLGLSGKSVIPMIVSCGCTVSGLMSTRTIENQMERKATIYLTPFMPCSAKMAVFGWFSYKFFSGNPLIATSMYALSIFAVVVSGLILKLFRSFNASEEGFILEMPTYRLPSFKDVFSVLKEKVKDFTAKAGSVIFLVSVAVWFLMNFGFKGYTYGVIENSFLYLIGNLLKFIFYPLGFGSWQASVSVISGFMAKEAVVETLELTGGIQNFNSVYSIYAFMSFILLSPPCIASITTASNELKNKKDLIFMLVFQTCIGYFFALIINTIGILVKTNLLLCFFIVIMILALCVLCSITLKKKKRCLCAKCKKGENSCKKNIKRSMI